MDIFAKRLKQARENKKITQQQIANLLGIDRTTITHWENGRNTPNPELLAKLAIILGVSADYLLGLEKQTWIYNLPKELLDFIHEEALAGKPIYLGIAEEIKESGILPETIKAFIEALLRQEKLKKGKS